MKLILTITLSFLSILLTYGQHQEFTLDDFFSNNQQLKKKVDQVFSSLSEEERVAQMLITSAGTNGKSDQEVSLLIKNKQIGGVLLLGGDKASFTEMVNKYNGLASESQSLPLLFSADAEPSLINYKIKGITPITKARDIKATPQSESVAHDINKILKAIGVHHNYAPVCDLAINSTIKNRSFSTNPKEVAKLSKAFILATQEDGVVATAKHFPGHSYVQGDSHTQLVKIEGELKELDVYREVIHAGVISIMVGHIAIKNKSSYATYPLPASCSEKAVTHLLRDSLHFNGLIITDAMNMGAVRKVKDPEFKAIQAGCDMILMPKDEATLIQKVINTFHRDEKLRNHVNEAAKKVIRLKICLGMI